MASFVQFRQIRRKTERMRNHLKLGFYSLANTPLFKFIFFFFGNCTLLASYKFAAGHTHFLFVAKMQSVHHHVANDSGFPTPLPQSLGVPALSSDPGEE